MSERDATVGETFTYPDHHHRDGSPITSTISPKCDTDSGRWYCAQHNVILANNTEAAGHFLLRGAHVRSWWCHEHGPEVP